MIADLWQDLRFGARMLVKNSGLTVITIITLAVGIGANTAVFSVFNAVMLKPLPVAQADQLVSVYTSDFSGTPYGGSSYPDYIDLRERADTLVGLTAFMRQTVSMTTVDRGEEFITADIVTGDYFDVLGVRAALGRTFLPDEDRTPGTHPVAVISHGCWQRRFGGDPSVVGKPIELSNQRYTVIGIAPPEFAGLVRGIGTDIWVPMMMRQQIMAGDRSLENRGGRQLSLIGRLKPNVSVEQAQAQFAVLAGQQRAAYPQDWADLTGKGRLITVLPESESRIPPQARDQAFGIAGLVMVVMLLVLGIACANLAGLFLARAVNRQKEIAVRLSLGASRWRLIRQLLSETLLVTVIGTCIGAILAWQAIRLALAYIPPMAIDFSPDALVLVFAIAVSLATNIVFGLSPAVQATKVDLTGALKDDTGLTGYRRSKLRNGLVLAQIAGSVLLLSMSGLFLRSLINAASIDPGFNSDNLLLVEMLRRDELEANGSVFYQQVLERVQTLPGVQSVSLVNRAGLDFDGTSSSVQIDGYNPQPGENMEISFNVAGPYYFKTLQTPLLSGRDFNERDVKGAPGVVIVNEALARRYFPGQNAVGKRLNIPGARGQSLEIIGVARDGKYRSLFEEPRPFFSLPILQHYQVFSNLMIRTGGDPRHLTQAVHREILALDPNLLIRNTNTMSEHIGFVLLPLRIASISSLAFGGLAMLLAGLGIYGLIAYLTGQRTREIGVRLALGAQRKDIVSLVLNQGLGIVVIGVALGIAIAFTAMQPLKSLLFGVIATDLLTLGVVAVSLAIVALLACWIPARRATRVDPVVALRHE